MLAGSTVGSAAGKKVSEGIDKTLRKTGGILGDAAKQGDSKQGDVKKPAAPAAATPLLKVSPGIPKAELNNVPPPPPPRRAAAPRPPAPRPAPPRVIPVPVAVPAPQPPLNVDLGLIAHGMPRDQVLDLGSPSARITMYQDGHLVEIFQYRNTDLASGTVRLLDGSVASVEARP